MISVLIPVHDFDVRRLVIDLHKQLSHLNIAFEIVVVDDASTNTELLNLNSQISDFDNVRYITKEHNLGRSKVRNLLADLAVYDCLIMMDCDAQVKNPDFVSRYLDFVKSHRLENSHYAIIGGVDYRADYPNLEKSLRYKYGVNREVRKAEQRSKNPYANFTPFNLCISKSAFNNCHFDESFSQYGYEDTFFGFQLKQNNIPIYHINNELYHEGIDSDEVFIKKIESSCENLVSLINNDKLPSDFKENSKLLTTYNYLSNSVLGKSILKILYKGKDFYKRSAIKKTSLKALDLYKLALLENLEKCDISH